MAATSQPSPSSSQRSQFHVPSLDEWTQSNPTANLSRNALRDSALWKFASEGVLISLQGLFFGGCSHMFSTVSFASAGVYGLSYGLSSSLTSRVKEYLFDMNNAGPVKKVISYIIEIGINLMAATMLTNSLGYAITFLEGFKVYALSTVVAMSGLGIVTLLFGAAVYNLFQSGALQNFIAQVMDDEVDLDSAMRV